MTEDTRNCCGPAPGARTSEEASGFQSAAHAVPQATPEVQAALRARLVPLEGGFFDMGARQSRFPEDLDSPRRRVRVSPFRIAPHAVTNADYAAFVEASGYRTVAEQEGWSYVFHLFLDDVARFPDYAGSAPWWRRVDGACWNAPDGPGSDWQDRPDHPAVHLAWYDALAYCRWAGLRLPREAEWEFAARGGLARKKYPWGNEMIPGGVHVMNTWQGEFPTSNTAEDGWLGTAPVGSFPPNGFGLYEMTGNVWEWVDDWYEREYYKEIDEYANPKGPIGGEFKVVRGGSWRDLKGFIYSSFRNNGNPKSRTDDYGFRCARDASPNSGPKKLTRLETPRFSG